MVCPRLDRPTDIEFPLSAYVQPIPLLQPLHFHGCIWVKELELPRATHGPPSSYTRAPGMRGGSPAAAGVAAAAFSLTPTFTPTTFVTGPHHRKGRASQGKYYRRLFGRQGDNLLWNDQWRLRPDQCSVKEAYEDGPCLQAGNSVSAFLARGSHLRRRR